MLWRQVAVSYGGARTRSHLGTGPVAGRVVRDPRLHQPPRPRRRPGGRRRRPGRGRRRADRGPGPARAHLGGAAGVVAPGQRAAAARRRRRTSGGDGGRGRTGRGGRAGRRDRRRGLKWPNDLVVGDRKLAGLLAEAEGDALVVGAGLQRQLGVVPRGARGRPPPPATSRPVIPSTATRCSTPSSTGSPTALAAGDAVLDDYRARLATLGRAVRVEHVRGDDLVGTAVGVTDDGRARRARRRRHRPHRRRRRRPPPPLTAASRFGVADPRISRVHDAETVLGVEVLGDEGVEGGAEGGGDGAGDRGHARGRRRGRSGCTSRVVEVRKASSASRSASSGSGVSSTAMPSGVGELEHERARHAEQAARRSRRRGDHAVAHDEHVGAGRLAQLVARVGEDRLARAALVRVRERAHVLGVRRGLQARGRAAVVAHPRHDDDAHRVGPRPQRAARDDAPSVPRVAAFGAERRDATGDRDAQPRLVVAVGRAARRTRPRAARRDRDGRVRGRTRSARAGRGGGSTRTARRRTRGWSRTRRRPRAGRGRTGRCGPRRRRRARRRATRTRSDSRAHDAARVAVRRLGARHREETRRLELGLGPLGVGSGVGDDAAADRELRAARRPACPAR